MAETYENCGGRIEEIVCEDRISALPEDLLLTILSSIPTKDAVSTMILSKRWRFIWTMLPVLAYRDNNHKRSVWQFLNNSMELHKAPVLQLLSIKLGGQCPTDADVEKWVENAVNRGLTVLYFSLLWPADPTRLPKSLYTCKTLQHLKLSHEILVDFPSCCLPSLETLRLYHVVYRDEASIVTLLSSCPVLKLLFVKREEDDNVANFSVKVPSLVGFLYVNYTSLPDDNDEVDTGRSLVMDTPALTNFYITDYSGDSYSIKNMPCLKDASIIGQSFHDIDKLLRSLSGVSSLDLDLTDEMAVYCSTIKFSQLIKCKIIPCDSDWMDSLVLFLYNTPKLKSLTVDYRFTHEPPAASASWMERSHYPECLLSSLEKFELIDYGGREEETELVEYILQTSKCLKTARISLRSKLEDKETIMETLKAIFLGFDSISLFVQT
ncbi:putative FBD-associated F-box protein At1g05080 [Eutrema salsugineum]|uniref:putative FBD-associated F-box protein At1g05080 n=1 Tax=Eutrema salsugineum TaxID=72664 RepID=UPI000CED7EDC|nr:putative FBD-associated F-box protein At1g05080 [Eutrema salsugineum]